MSSLVVNGRFLSQGVTGVQRYATELVSALSRRNGADSFHVLTPANAHPLVPSLETRQVGILNGHLWEQLELPRFSRKELLLSLCNTGPLYHSNQVPAVHDAAVFAAAAGFSGPFLAWYRYLLPRLCRRARLVLTVSEFSKGELVRYCGADPRKIEVVPNGTDHIDRIVSDPGALEKFRLCGRPFVLGVGSLHPNKNFKIFMEVAEAFAGKGVAFVVAGGGNSQVFAQSGHASDHVRFLGYVTDSELKALYSAATCFLFPSLYEGFGIPPLEAMRCGCPVLASSAASLPEVCGDAALYASPHSAAEFTRQMSRVLESEALREEMTLKGKEKADHFRWDESAARLASSVARLS
ncbi:glycosyltransferase family 4 protein [Geomonas sp. RF6]|uniref:glycosyltransferase family 4 protein n=1 Tax=Geomonas sp. RF6 TaxID=2897342 RepID=UPI001E59E556|nr:glycosyltransferase family 1 protein [Geomonas sp. RF6]UFS69772.1 glycosyltransferase family 4 protein [Geomonas sp. RF6]